MPQSASLPGRALAQAHEYEDLVARADLVAGHVAHQANDAAGAEQLLQRALEWARAETIQTLPAAQTVLAATELADRLGTARAGAGAAPRGSTDAHSSPRPAARG